MNPVSTALLVVGYLLAVPLIGHLSSIIKKQRRLAFAGHQLGVLITTVGWAIKGIWPVAIAQIFWLIGTRIWFSLAGQDAASKSH